MIECRSAKCTRSFKSQPGMERHFQSAHRAEAAAQRKAWLAEIDATPAASEINEASAERSERAKYLAASEFGF